MAEQVESKHWIGGEWVRSGTQKNSINPANGKTIGTFHDGGSAEAQAAITAARQAFREGPWRHDPMLRSTALSHLADAYQARLKEVIDTLCLENGKTRYEATFEAQFIIRGLRFAAGLATQAFGRVMDATPGHLLAPAGGRRRPDHPLELARVPHDPGAGAGTCRRLHRRGEDALAGRSEFRIGKRDHRERDGDPQGRGQPLH